MRKSGLLSLIASAALVGCGPSAARFEHTTPSRFPATQPSAVDFYPSLPAGSEKIGEVSVTRSHPRGGDEARDAARWVARRLAAENGATDLVIVSEDLSGQPRRNGTARLQADAGRRP